MILSSVLASTRIKSPEFLLAAAISSSWMQRDLSLMISASLTTVGLFHFMMDPVGEGRGTRSSPAPAVQTAFLSRGFLKVMLMLFLLTLISNSLN